MTTKYQRLTEALRLPSYLAAIGVFLVMAWDGVDDTFLRLLGILATFIGSEAARYVLAGLLILMMVTAGAYGLRGVIRRIDRLERKALMDDNVPHLAAATAEMIKDAIQNSNSNTHGMLSALLAAQAATIGLVQHGIPDFKKDFIMLLDNVQNKPSEQLDPAEKSAMDMVLKLLKEKSF